MASLHPDIINAENVCTFQHVILNNFHYTYEIEQDMSWIQPQIDHFSLI
jgi:hypothetical protein